MSTAITKLHDLPRQRTSHWRAVNERDNTMLTSGPSLSAAPVTASTSCAEILVRLPAASTRVEMVAKAACRPLQHASGHQCDCSQAVQVLS